MKFLRDLRGEVGRLLSYFRLSRTLKKNSKSGDFEEWVVKKSLKRKWSFSNFVSFCRIHLFNYIHPTKFLESPKNDWELDTENGSQLGLFDNYLANE
jgi:hypothetical protein